MKERKKYQSQFGKIVDEVAEEQWKVKFSSKEDLRVEKSSQLTVVDKCDLTKQAYSWLQDDKAREEEKSSLPSNIPARELQR